MKKAAALFIILVLILFQYPAYAITIENNSANGDKVSVIGNIRVDERTNGDVVTIAGNADIYNDVSGDVVVIIGNVTIDARVSGDVVSVLGTVTLTDKAEIMGDLVSVGMIDRADGAVIHGQNIVVSMASIGLGNFNNDFFIFVISAGLIVTLLLILILGFLLISIASQRFQNMDVFMDSGAGRKLAIGFLGLLGSFIVMLLLCWTVLIPVAYVLLLLAAKVTAAIYLGKLLTKLLNAHLNIYLEFITGLLFIALIKIIFVVLMPQGYLISTLLLDTVLNAVINSFGIGILIETKFGKRQF